MSGHRPRRIWNALAATGVAAVMALPSGLGNSEGPHLPEKTALKQLDDSRTQALTGTRDQLRDFMIRDIATYWPGLAERVTVVQGDGPDATTRQEFGSQFRTVFERAAGVKAQGRAYADLEAHEFKRSNDANKGGTPITIPLMAANGGRFAVISMPHSLCPSCDNPQASRCEQVHPDTLYFESRNRMNVAFHEQAHAVRHLLGLFRYVTDHEKHREEVIANVYAHMRMIQIFGQPAIDELENRQRSEPVTKGSSRHYIDHKVNAAMLAWYRKDPRAFGRLHPHTLLQRAADFAEPHLYSPEQLAAISNFEAQEDFVKLGSTARIKLLPEGEQTEKVTHEGKTYDYPAIMQQVDREVAAMRLRPNTFHARYYAANPYRMGALRGIVPFERDPANPAHVAVLERFNQRYPKTMNCPAQPAKSGPVPAAS